MIIDDLNKIADRKGIIGFIKYFYFHRGFKAVVLFRLSRWLFLKKVRIIPDLVNAYTITLTGADIPYTADIGKGLSILHPVGVVVGSGCKIGENATFMQGVTIGAKWSKDGVVKFPIIGNNVVLGAGSKILGGLIIGDNVTIGANAVVLTDIPPNSIAIGIPARVK